MLSHAAGESAPQVRARAHIIAIKSRLTAAKSMDSRSFRWFREARRRGPVIGG